MKILAWLAKGISEREQVVMSIEAWRKTPAEGKI
jgi:hypothetical protein